MYRYVFKILIEHHCSEATEILGTDKTVYIGKKTTTAIPETHKYCGSHPKIQKYVETFGDWKSNPFIKKEVIGRYETKDELKHAESLLVTKDFIRRPEVINESAVISPFEKQERPKKRDSNEYILSKIVKTSLPERKSRRPFQNLTGKKFNRWTAQGYVGETKAKTKYWWCHCSCGSEPRIVAGQMLVEGKTKSCGCYAVEVSTTHGLKKDPWYSVAADQQKRMTNPQSKHYKDYGGRGLKFGEGFETIEERILFYRSFFGTEKPKDMYVDRIDNNRGYAKDNVRLVSNRENCLNRRDSHGHCINIKTGKATSIYHCWQSMKKRHKGMICKRWEIFKNFFEDMGEKDSSTRLERFDKTKPFFKDNCYFKKYRKV
jgi:hypothetical protein